MKKIISTILISIILLAMVGCSVNESDENKDDIELYTITGRYCISTNGTNILLSKDNGAICIRPANNDELFSDLEIGDEIEISISDIEETYPAQATVYSYTLIKKGTVEDLDTDEIQALQALGWKFSFEVETQ
jgi:hypothetical protein